MDRSELKLSTKQRQRLESTLQWLSPVHSAAFVEACKADLAQGDGLLLDGEVIFDAQKITDIAANRTYGSQGQHLLSACLGSYSARIPGRDAASLASGLDLLPGKYRFHVAPRTNLVVDVDPRADSSDHSQQMEQVLLHAQRISADTLRENRQGRMTEEQRQTLRAAPKSYAGTGFAILGLICALATTTSVMSALEKNKSLLSPPILIAAMLTVLFFAFLPSMLIEQRKSGPDTQADANEGRLVARDGVLRKKHTMHRSLISFTLTLGEHNFDVTDKPEVFAAAVEGHTYRAWVAPRSGRLIALEFLHENDKG